MRVFVEGRLSTRSYDTPEGQRRWVTEVVAKFVALPLGNAHPSQPEGPFGASGKWVHRDLVPAALDNLGIPHREMRTFHSDKQLILEDKEPCLEKDRTRRPRRKVCQCCVDHVDTIDYKNVSLLFAVSFLKEARFLPRRVTGTCAKHQQD